MPDAFKTWYAEEGSDGWTLNESNPGASDGWLADFGRGGEDACKRAAREHNAIPDLYEAVHDVLAVLDCLTTEASAPYTPIVLGKRVRDALRAAVAKMGG